MNHSKVFQPLIPLTKNLIFIFSLLMMLLTFKGCDLFGDEEHCQYESNESRIWLPDQHFYDMVTYKNLDGSAVDASYWLYFNHSSSYKKDFVIENVCPLGVLAVNIKITQKDNIGIEHSYLGAIYEVLSGKGKNRLVFIKKINFRISGNEYISYDEVTNNNILLPLDGIELEGPQKFVIACSAHVDDISKYGGNIENWPKDNILKVEFKAKYLKWY